jgi:hypothetical protein
MTTQELATTDAVIVGVPMMDATEARETTAFDYADLDSETRIVVQQKTGEIRERMRRAAHDILEIGERLIDIQQRLSHGTWEAWLQAEFAWSDQTARRYIHVARAFSGKQQIVAFAPSALYLLASPGTPEDARNEALARAESGVPITHKAAQRIVEQHRPAPARPTIAERTDATPIGTPNLLSNMPPAEIAPEVDLPPDFAIVKRRLAAHNIALLSNMQGHHRAFVTRREGMTGVVTFNWADVLSKLERLESDQPAPAAPAGWACEQCGVIVTDMRKPMNPICSTCIIQHQSDRQAHLVKESRDSGRLERARSFIAASEYDAARTVLDGIEVSTRERDRLRTQIARDAALAFHNNQRARLKNFSDAAMISQKTFIQSLDHIEALLNWAVVE